MNKFCLGLIFHVQTQCMNSDREISWQIYYFLQTKSVVVDIVLSLFACQLLLPYNAAWIWQDLIWLILQPCFLSGLLMHHPFFPLPALSPLKFHSDWCSGKLWLSLVDKVLSGVWTPIKTHLHPCAMGMDFSGVQNPQPVPIPQIYPYLYPHGLPYLWHSLITISLWWLQLIKLMIDFYCC